MCDLGDPWLFQLERWHKEVMEVVLTIPSSYIDIGEQLSNVHAEQKIKL